MTEYEINMQQYLENIAAQNAEMMKQFDYIVEPIYGAGSYNHLCVRSAAAIILDRLLGEPWWNTKEGK